jgi:hypothetical protein
MPRETAKTAKEVTKNSNFLCNSSSVDQVQVSIKH